MSELWLRNSGDAILFLMKRPGTRRIKVLLVEDHASLAKLTAQLIEEAECEVIGPARIVSEALELAAAEQPDLALVDLSLPGGSGEELIRELRQMGVCCAIHTGHERPTMPPAVLADLPWLSKPLDIDQFRGILNDVG